MAFIIASGGNFVSESKARAASTFSGRTNEMLLMAAFNTLVLSSEALSPPGAGARLLAVGCAAGGLPMRLGLNSISIILFGYLSYTQILLTWFIGWLKWNFSIFHRTGKVPSRLSREYCPNRRGELIASQPPELSSNTTCPRRW